MNVRELLNKSTLKQRVYTVVWLLVTLVTIQLAVLFFSMTIISALRVFINGESIWAKSQKSAVISLYKYVQTKDEKFYQNFFEELKPIRSFQSASQAIFQPKINEDIVREGLRGANIVEPDINRSLVMIRLFRNESFFRESLNVWDKANDQIDRMHQLALDLRQKIKNQAPPEEIQKILDDVSAIDSALTTEEMAYTHNLGQSSRLLEKLFGAVQTTLTVTALLIALLSITLILRAMNRRLQDMIYATNQIQIGNYDVDLPLHSKDEFGQLANSINSLATELTDSMINTEKAEHSNRVKSMFLANMSHEIRTPLSAILGYTELLKEDGIPDREKDFYLNVIQRTGEHLNSIISDILDISKIEAGHLEINKSVVHLPTIIHEVRSVLESRARGKKLELIIEESPNLPEYIVTDPNRLKQILFNVGGNAVKFTSHGYVKISIDQKINSLIFLVSDTGIGIPESDQNQIFNQFKKASNNSSEKIEGTGLGLALSRLLAKLLGGTVKLVDSKPGRGSSFAAEIALVKPTENFIANKPPTISDTDLILSLDKVTVLVVDDVEDNRYLVKRLLEKRGAQVLMAENGAQSLEMVKAHPEIDIILMDIQMPVLDGYEATKALRKMDYKLPIIALTANAMSEDRNNCLKAGCDDYLAKPINTSDLVRKLHHLLNSSKITIDSIIVDPSKV